VNLRESAAQLGDEPPTRRRGGTAAKVPGGLPIQLIAQRVNRSA
jgi:hypothetical protein